MTLKKNMKMNKCRHQCLTRILSWIKSKRLLANSLRVQDRKISDLNLMWFPMIATYLLMKAKPFTTSHIKILKSSSTMRSNAKKTTSQICLKKSWDVLMRNVEILKRK